MRKIFFGLLWNPRYECGWWWWYFCFRCRSPNSFLPVIHELPIKQERIPGHQFLILLRLWARFKESPYFCWSGTKICLYGVFKWRKLGCIPQMWQNNGGKYEQNEPVSFLVCFLSRHGSAPRALWARSSPASVTSSTFKTSQPCFQLFDGHSSWSVFKT